MRERSWEDSRGWRQRSPRPDQAFPSGSPVARGAGMMSPLPAYTKGKIEEFMAKLNLGEDDRSTLDAVAVQRAVRSAVASPKAVLSRREQRIVERQRKAMVLQAIQKTKAEKAEQAKIAAAKEQRKQGFEVSQASTIHHHACIIIHPSSSSSSIIMHHHHHPSSSSSSIIIHNHLSSSIITSSLSS